MITRYDYHLARKKAEYGDKFSADDLNPAFIDAFNNGNTFRVLVELDPDECVWGFVGITGGWKPIFLLMRRRGQIASSDTIGMGAKIIAHKWLQ